MGDTFYSDSFNNTQKETGHRKCAEKKKFLKWSKKTTTPHYSYISILNTDDFMFILSSLQSLL